MDQFASEVTNYTFIFHRRRLSASQKMNKKRDLIRHEISKISNDIEYGKILVVSFRESIYTIPL